VARPQQKISSNAAKDVYDDGERYPCPKTGAVDRVKRIEVMDCMGKMQCVEEYGDSTQYL
jgi:hypothetical protein